MLESRQRMSQTSSVEENSGRIVRLRALQYQKDGYASASHYSITHCNAIHSISTETFLGSVLTATQLRAGLGSYTMREPLVSGQDCPFSPLPFFVERWQDIYLTGSIDPYVSFI